MKYNVLPNYVDTIIINKTQTNEKIARYTGIPLNKYGQIELTMEFRDGIAYDIEKRVVMTYPKLEKLKGKSGDKKRMELLEKVSILCDEINQYDCALAFGTLWFGREFS